MKRAAVVDERDAAAQRVADMERQLRACRALAAEAPAPEVTLTLADVERELAERHPKVAALLSDYKGRMRERAVAEYMAARGLRDYVELLVYLNGDAEDGGLRVAPSSIPAAGDGLFAARPFPAGELICVYRGVRLSLPEVNRLDITSGERDYIMGGFGFLWHINAGPYTHVKARYINDDHATPDAHNVRFVKLKNDLCAKVVAARDIAAGEELFAKYGESFWKCRGVAAPYPTQ